MRRIAIVLIASAIVILRLRHSDKLGLKKKISIIDLLVSNKINFF